MKKIIGKFGLWMSFSIVLFLTSCASVRRWECFSPDGNLTVKVYRQKSGEMSYTLQDQEKLLLTNSALGFQTTDGRNIPNEDWNVKEVSSRLIRDEWKPLWGKRETVKDCFNEQTLVLENKKPKEGEPASMQLVFRVYDDGLAFRYLIPQYEGAPGGLPAESTTFHFADDYQAWYYNNENHNIGPERLTETDGIRQPVMTIQADDNHYLAVHEAYLQNDEPLLLKSKANETIFSIASKPHINPKENYESAWRVIMYGQTPGILVDSHILELLNPEPDEKYAFQEWVKPGISLWDWRINGAIWDGFRYEMNYPSWIKMVDFAARQGFSYLVLDANWYGPEFEKDSDPVKGDKANDVKRLLAYAKEKNVGIWLYLNDVGGRQYPLEETLKNYSEWGAVGIKYGFMNGNSYEKNQRTQWITRLCAENRLFVDYHDGPIHPFGQMRTWPNALTREYCQAQLDGHKIFHPKTFVTSVFVNMLAGPLDMNNGFFDLRQGRTTRVDESRPVPSTVVAESARTLITFSGATILPDIPEYYEKYPSLLNFLSAQKMPWKESRTLDGKIGEYIVMMRETDEAYLLAAATNEGGRTLEVSLDFLPEGTWSAVVTEDGPEAHYMTNRETLQDRIVSVSKDDKLSLKLAPGGGACVLIKK